MHKVVVIGAGKIGSAIVKLLHRSGRYQLKVIEQNSLFLKDLPSAHSSNLSAAHSAAHHAPAIEKVELDVANHHALVQHLQGWEAVISACSFDVNAAIAHAALMAGVSYFDLTEDVETTLAIRHHAQKAVPGQIFMPQCGLAPGFIGILAADMAAQFDKLDVIKMRVGALPKYPSNKMMYNLTWSTDGLINEYCNPCDAIEAGHAMKLQALEGLEHLSLDGIEYEAFNTSGGLGTLCETLDGKVRELNYKTVRYKGHQYLMEFLIRELQLGDGSRRALLKHVFETSVPITKQDVVLTFVSVSGWRHGMLEQVTDARKIYHRDIQGEAWSSIQLTTASSACAVVDLFFDQRLPTQGFVRQEDVSLKYFLANEFGKVYAVAEPISGV